MSATTPHRANMSPAHSPSKSTPRRVLGCLPPKALNTPSKQTHVTDSSEPMRAQSPLKQVTTLSSKVFVDKENVTSIGAYAHGRKRSIYEVDDAENVENAKSRFAARDQGISRPTDDLTAAAIQRHMENADIELPVPGSPTERNTPTPEPEGLPEGANSQETQASRESFSTFINYGACASQNSDQAQPSFAEEEKKSRADLLRTRLGFSMYKVKTNQVEKRGSEIISTWETSSSPESNEAATPKAATSSTEAVVPHAVPSITLSPVGHDSQPVFVKASLDPFRPIGKLTPAPVLLPTAVSSRMVHDYQMPSSPPQVVSPDQLMSPVKSKSNYTTPVPKRTRTEEEQEEEDDDDEREETIEERLQRLHEKRFRDGDLTSSAVKGHAAKGLMELMAGRR